jgi:uncharacterized RDD family membrane protein YckC
MLVTADPVFHMKTETHIIRRALAAGIDYTLVFGLVWVYLIAFGQPTGDAGYKVENWWSMVILFGIWLVLVPLIEGIAGFTLGKGLLGLQVVNNRGHKVSLGSAFLRHSLDVVDLSSGGIIGLLAVLLTPTHQRLGDLLAKTRVISDAEARVWKFIDEAAV